jgi:hypothetical protein
MEHDKVLDRVRKLIERATHPATPEQEAESAQAMADKFMIDYAIEQADLDASRPAEMRATPEVLRMEMCGAGSPFKDQLYQMSGNLVDLCRLEAVYHGLKGRWGVDMTLVGYPADLRYFQMLYTSLFLQLHANLEPKLDPKKGLDENVYILHEAGVSYRRMVHMLFPEIPHYRESEIKKAGGRCKSAYRRWCKKIGEEPRAIVSPVTYQRNFAIGFTNQIYYRIAKMMADRPTSGALALRYESVKEKHNELFPKVGKPLKPKEVRYNDEAIAAGREAADRADLSGAKIDNGNRAQLN